MVEYSSFTTFDRLNSLINWNWVNLVFTTYQKKVIFIRELWYRMISCITLNSARNSEMYFGLYFEPFASEVWYIRSLNVCCIAIRRWWRTSRQCFRMEPPDNKFSPRTYYLNSNFLPVSCEMKNVVWVVLLCRLHFFLSIKDSSLPDCDAFNTASAWSMQIADELQPYNVFGYNYFKLLSIIP